MSHDDFDRRYQFCAFMLQGFETCILWPPQAQPRVAVAWLDSHAQRICVSEQKGDARPLYQLGVWNADLRVHDDDPSALVLQAHDASEPLCTVLMETASTAQLIVELWRRWRDAGCVPRPASWQSKSRAWPSVTRLWPPHTWLRSSPSPSPSRGRPRAATNARPSLWHHLHQRLHRLRWPSAAAARRRESPPPPYDAL